jgi:hypothetical protein
MSAGIVSACLPTMLPVISFGARFLGLKSPAGSRVGSKGYRANDKSNVFLQGGNQGNFPDTSSKGASNNFYRLPDGNSSDGTSRGAPSTALEAKLRPDSNACEYTVKCHPSSSRDDQSGDDIPLQGIRVDTKFRRSTVKN